METTIQSTEVQTLSTKGTRRVTEVDKDRADDLPPSDSEVLPKKSRRRFSQAYKKRILEEYERLANDGEKGAFLRREGLYTQHISKWRQELLDGKWGYKSKSSALNKEDRHRLKELERENKKLQKKLDTANKIIDFQKKNSEILQIPLDGDDENG